MRVAYFDCPSGASGDMILGALVDAGVPLRGARARARQARAGRLHARAPRGHASGAFRATKVDVRARTPHECRPRTHRAAARHPRRSSARSRLRAGGDRRTGRRAIFTRLAEAEARVHGTTPERVHFHDVGAVDAIVDVTGACIGLHLLGVGRGARSARCRWAAGFVRGPARPDARCPARAPPSCSRASRWSTPASAASWSPRPAPPS